ncbi:MAG: AAA domain-containing protein [Chloroflexota bacterium]
MPFTRRPRRRLPFKSTRWQQRTLASLCLHLAPTVRSSLTAWLKIYGETGELPGLATGPLELRFRRLLDHAQADELLLWSTPDRWSSGAGLSLRIPAIGLDMDCRFAEGRLLVDRARPTAEGERDPRRSNSTVGIELRPDRVELPPPDDADSSQSSINLEAAFERLIGRRWSGFVGPLREALEAEAKDDLERAQRLAAGYAAATPRIGGHSESDPYRLTGVDGASVAAFDEGEWLDLMDTRGRVISSARLVRIDPAEGALDVDVRGADPPSSGTVRPRPQTQIFAQKRAILEELDNPTGGLQHAVRLVASPSSLPPLVKHRPPNLVNRLIGRNRSQLRAVSLALGLDAGQALMVQGPPGTGKSTTLAEIIGQIVLRDPNATLLVCSHSNHGVDNLLLKTLPYLEEVPGLAIARVGLFDRVHPEGRKHYVPPGEDLGAYNVVFTTVDALALQTEAGARTYDYAVLDEANRASILDSLIPLVRGHRFILVGDHLQLQPVLSEAEEQLRLEPAVARTSAIGKSLFAWLRERRFPEAATVFLEEQNRMHPSIAGLISEVFYEGRLRSGPRAPRRQADVPLFPAPVTWVDTQGLHGLREARGRGTSLMNVPEARLVTTIVRHVLSSAPAGYDVGVIAAYAEQTALLRRLLRERGPSGPLAREVAAERHLEVDTVDAFEGREKDVIIVSLVRSNRRRDIGFLRLMQRINVALSRARRLLVVVGDASTLRGSYFDRIIRYVRSNGMVIAGPRLIGRLLNARATGTEGGRTSKRRPPIPRPQRASRAQTVSDAEIEAPVPTASSAEAEARPAPAKRRRRRHRRRGEAGRAQGSQPIEAAANGALTDALTGEATSSAESTPAVASFAPLVPESPAPVISLPPAEAAAVPRRRGRRTAAAADTPPVVEASAPPPVGEGAPAPRRRRASAPLPEEISAPPAAPEPAKPRRRRTAAPPSDQPATTDTAVQAPKPRRSRARTDTPAAAEAVSAPSTPPVEALIIRPSVRRTRKPASDEATAIPAPPPQPDAEVPAKPVRRRRVALEEAPTAPISAAQPPPTTRARRASTSANGALVPEAPVPAARRKKPATVAPAAGNGDTQPAPRRRTKAAAEAVTTTSATSPE